MELNLFLSFPRGSAGYNTLVNPTVEKRLAAARLAGLIIIIHRTDDLFEVLWLTKENWREQTNLAKRHFPEARRLQFIG